MAYEFNHMVLASGNGLGKLTATAGTVLNQIAKPRANCLTRISKWSYLNGTTAHTLTTMRPQGWTYLTAAALSGQAVINVFSTGATPTTQQQNPNPGALAAKQVLTSRAMAANDWLVIRNDDGTLFVAQVLSVSGLAITLTANLVAALSATVIPPGNTGGSNYANNVAPLSAGGLPPLNGKVWFYGLVTDTDPITGQPHPQWDAATVSVVNALNDDFAGNYCSHNPDDPLLIQSNNLTAAGFFEQVSYFHTPVQGAI